MITALGGGTNTMNGWPVIKNPDHDTEIERSIHPENFEPIDDEELLDEEDE